MPAKVAVVGAGSWGTVFADLVSTKAPTVVWARRKELADEIGATRRNARYLGRHILHPELAATASIQEAVEGAELVVMAVPSHGFRVVLSHAQPWLGPGVPVVSLTKGLEQGSLRRMTEVVAEVAPGRPAGVLTGPNLAREIMAGFPAASVLALEDAELARELQLLFSTDGFRVYTNPDVTGCEVAGAIKNVVAIASGMADGMGLGDNARAALITRGLAELSRLGIALGGQPTTFSGLAGIGDLVVTCMSAKSRNRNVGEELGKGHSIEDIVATTNMVAEGVKTSRAVLDLADAVGVEMPIAEQVVAVLYHGKEATEVITTLMQRESKPELWPDAGAGAALSRP
ncbi:MAG TPA: NAD(P)H-dependent glycerol-3-phosphate dehydrogenase [Acidimicrobiales bacterium]|nr:NAD(P)H-dependent glycerol-3-phosphate dehydrogenase [Acidimicrobiales bacterium]